jgi:hypothetical protein
MLTTVITALIYICLFALVVYLVIWILRDIVGLPIPPKVIQILWVIVALIAILWLVQMVLGGGGSLKLGGLFRSEVFGGGALAALSTAATVNL